MGTKSTKPTVLITGSSGGIGAVYADRFARRGHDLVLVARNAERMATLAGRLQRETGVSVNVAPADLTDPQDLGRIEQRLREDACIGVLVNNAGTTIPKGFLRQSGGAIAKLIALNVTAPTRLANAVAPRFADTGDGAIINISSIVGLGPELGSTVYGATKAFVLFLSQGLSVELTPKGVYVQAVLPAATRTEIWEHGGVDVNTLAGVMEVEDLVDAALVGFDRRETVTIPPLPDVAQWRAFEAARQAMLPNFAQAHPAERYRSAA
jgi:uncharacterized protein